MPLNEHEEKTIASFFLKEKRERYRHLLGDPEKRRIGMGRLSHCRDLDPRFVQWLSRKVNAEDLLRQNGCPKDVYVFASSEDFGQMLPLKEALNLVEDYGWGNIISCIPGELAFYYDEIKLRRALLKR